jgi:hypothetical protein
MAPLVISFVVWLPQKNRPDPVPAAPPRFFERSEERLGHELPLFQLACCLFARLRALIDKLLGKDA